MKKILSRLILVLVLAHISTCEVQVHEVCEDTSKLCVRYSKYCYGNILKACKKTCNMCPTTTYEGSCEFQSSGCEQLCEEMQNTVKCSCLPGYILNTDMKTCEDINECEMGVNPCSQQSRMRKCINTRGSYFCTDESPCSLKEGHTNYYNSSECCKLDFDTCGQNTVNSGRIVGGKESVIGRWPWMGRIERRNRMDCGGTLISKQWLLTAAHCIRYKKDEYEVIFGEILRQKDPKITHTYRQVRKIAELILHEEFRFPKHDIALIKLDTPVIISDYVSPICLPDGERPKIGQKCWATGYGYTSYLSQMSDILHEVDLPIVSSEDCSRSFGRFYVITEDMLCAGYKEGGKDTCYGDSGGPLACQRCSSCSWYVAGLTSYGQGCAEPAKYGVYTDITSHEEWIRQRTGMRTVGCGGKKDGMWSPWTAFSQCSASCGQTGTKTRIKECSVEMPECTLNKIQKEECQGTCEHWTAWGNWLQCSATCGGGEWTRQRECAGGEEGDPGCQGNMSEKEKCNSQPCTSTPGPEITKCTYAEMDTVDNCDGVLEMCDTFKAFMNKNCQMTCCLHSLYGQIITPRCEDDEESAQVCGQYKSQCSSTMYGTYFKDNCKKTCGFC